MNTLNLLATNISNFKISKFDMSVSSEGSSRQQLATTGDIGYSKYSKLLKTTVVSIRKQLATTGDRGQQQTSKSNSRKH